MKFLHDKKKKCKCQENIYDTFKNSHSFTLEVEDRKLVITVFCLKKEVQVILKPY